MTASLFLDFSLPNAATWFYFSLFLCVALFFQFLKPFALRNWDLLLLFTFVPGFLMVQNAARPDSHSLLARYLGYGWLLMASALWFIRCMLDTVAKRRATAVPNLTAPGLIWFCSALFVCMGAVAYRTESHGSIGKQPAVITGMEKSAVIVLEKANEVNGFNTNSDRIQYYTSRTLALVCHAAVALGLWQICRRHFGDSTVGVAAATLYLLLPYTAMYIGQVHHVWPAALITWAVYFYKRQRTAGLFLGLAAGSTFFPILLLPAWLQFYKNRSASRFALAFVLSVIVGVMLTILALWFSGDQAGALWQNAVVADWQPWKTPKSESVWTGVHSAYRLPLFVVYIGFVISTITWPQIKNIGQLVAVSAAIIIGIQFWFADRGGIYVLWYLPLLLIMVLRPNTSDMQPEPVNAGNGYFRRSEATGNGKAWEKPEPKTIAV